jgi:hypothetical protein
MKSTKLLLALAATAFAGSASAQSAFEGFYGQIGTGYENNTIQNTPVVVVNQGQTYSSTGSGTASVGGAPLSVGLGYTFSLAPQFTLGLGADYSTLSQTTGTATGYFSATDSAALKYKISNRYNVFLAPGYAIDKDKLAYFKVGYSNQKIEAQNADGSGGSLGSATTSGYVLGLGYKQIISGGFYGFAEANYYNYSKPTISKSYTEDNGTSSVASVKPGNNAYNVLVGVGYKF